MEKDYGQSGYGQQQQQGYSGGYPPPQGGYIQTAQPGHQTTTNVVIMNQPGGLNAARDFSSGVCACCDDCESCIMGALFPDCYICCVLYPRHHESCCYPFNCPFAIPMLRAKHRNRHNIVGSLFDDAFMGTCPFIALCTMCQLKRDMDFVEGQGKPLWSPESANAKLQKAKVVNHQSASSLVSDIKCKFNDLICITLIISLISL